MYQMKRFSQLTGVAPETIRYYERIGLLVTPQRSTNKYRQYTDADVQRLRLIRRARQLDFSLENIGEILAFRDNDRRPCDYVLRLIQEKAAEIQSHIDDLQQLRDELKLLETKVHRPVANRSGSCICQIIEA